MLSGSQGFSPLLKNSSETTLRLDWDNLEQPLEIFRDAVLGKGKYSLQYLSPS